MTEPEGTLLVGGILGANSEEPAPGLIRLDENGSLVRDFRGTFPFDTWPSALALQPDGARLMAGWAIGQKLARFTVDGIVDHDFDAGQGPSADVHQLELFDDGRILAGGVFFDWNGQPRHALALLLPDGRLDPEFKPRLGQQTLIRARAKQGQTRVLVGGQIYRDDSLPLGSLVALYAPP